MYESSMDKPWPQCNAPHVKYSRHSLAAAKSVNQLFEGEPPTPSSRSRNARRTSRSQVGLVNSRLEIPAIAALATALNLEFWAEWLMMMMMMMMMMCSFLRALLCGGI